MRNLPASLKRQLDLISQFLYLNLDIGFPGHQVIQQIGLTSPSTPTVLMSKDVEDCRKSMTEGTEKDRFIAMTKSASMALYTVKAEVEKVRSVSIVPQGLLLSPEEKSARNSIYKRSCYISQNIAILLSTIADMHIVQEGETSDRYSNFSITSNSMRIFSEMTVLRSDVDNLLTRVSTQYPDE